MISSSEALLSLLCYPPTWCLPPREKLPSHTTGLPSKSFSKTPHQLSCPYPIEPQSYCQSYWRPSLFSSRPLMHSHFPHSGQMFSLRISLRNWRPWVSNILIFPCLWPCTSAHIQSPFPSFWRQMLSCPFKANFCRSPGLSCLSKGFAQLIVSSFL